MERFNLDGEKIKPLTICLIGGGGFIGSHLCEKLLYKTQHTAIIIDVSSTKIKHLLRPYSCWFGRVQFHEINVKRDTLHQHLEPLIAASDLVINLAAIRTPANYNTRPLDTIKSNSVDAIPVVEFCIKYKKRLIHFSSCEVYGKTIGSFLPKDHALQNVSELYLLKEYDSPCIFGSIDKQRWTYACAKQMIERLIYAQSALHSLEFTIVRPFNWIGPRMDFIRGIDGPREGVPRVLACFTGNLLRGKPLKLVDGGQSQRSFCYIKEAIEAVLLIIENPARANGKIFNVGNPENDVTIKQLAELMMEVYADETKQPASKFTTIDVSSNNFYGPGYDDSDKRIPDMTIINRELGWKPAMRLRTILKLCLDHAIDEYKSAIKNECDSLLEFHTGYEYFSGSE
ncbi:UDP-D-apiose/UDP-D-xylose synthase 2-like [Pistacia vera]|uniref:UDP-D-apiose/UDP-D-xylose synthase 2-like n=1 Tax=Pistacia vera TaxID=55513 RepID=UPI0012635B77|nr:UDP-D-apiose/UDP-D-xylose synthase 2-like [Pistacia vera]